MDRCEGTSTGIPFYSFKFYVDFANFKCALDCEFRDGRDRPCGGNPTDPNAVLYDNEEDCCQGGIGWVRRSQCIADTYGATNNGSRDWYVAGNNCVMDCLKGPPPDQNCGGLKDNWMTGYTDRPSCCDNSAVFWNKANCLNLPVP